MATKRKRAPRPAPLAERTILVMRTSGERLRLRFPAGWRMTLSKGLSPNDQAGPFDGGVLRLYETSGRQRTVLRNVSEFFDLTDLVIERQKDEVVMLPPAEGQRGRVDNVPHRTYLDEWEPLLTAAMPQVPPKRQRGRWAALGLAGLAEGHAEQYVAEAGTGTPVTWPTATANDIIEHG